MPRRKPGTLLPLEQDIIRIAMSMRRNGENCVHGFGLARAMGEHSGGRLIAHGTLYKALGRLEEMGLLVSQWEKDPPEGRPRRRLYELTATGVSAALTPAAAPREPASSRRLSPGTA